MWQNACDLLFPGFPPATLRAGHGQTVVTDFHRDHTGCEHKTSYSYFPPDLSSRI